MRCETNLNPRLVTEAKSWWKALLFSLPMALLTLFMCVGNIGGSDSLHLLAAGVIWAFYNVLFFLMLKTGKTDKYRALLFVVIALGFTLFFTTNLIEVRGSTTLTAANAVEGRTPFCHIVIPMVLIPAALTRTIIFPGSMTGGFANIAMMLVIWIGATLTLGRGWCSWACFYGGWDEGFSRILKKPLIKKIDRRWTYLPFAVLAAVVLLSAATLSPVYCQWLCPFKTVTEHEAVTSVKILVQTIFFLGLFLGLVMVLPLLTKKRTQCGLFCPFGAMQSFTNKINVFEVRIDREKCVDCQLCVKTCPTFSLDERSVEAGKTLITCTKCGHCIDRCPKGAVSYHIKGTKVGISPNKARLLFLYTAFLFTYTFTGWMVAGALWRILKLIMTGHMI